MYLTMWLAMKDATKDQTKKMDLLIFNIKLSRFSKECMDNWLYYGHTKNTIYRPLIRNPGRFQK